MLELETNKASLAAQFWAAAAETLFDEKTLVAVLGFSEAWAQRCRWSGRGGPPFIKLNRAIRYRKRDILSWIALHQSPVTAPKTECASRYADKAAERRAGA